MFDFIHRVTIHFVLAVLFIYCIFSIEDINMFERTTSLTQTIPIFLVGTLYFIYTIWAIFSDPYKRGYIALVSGLVIFEIYGTIVNVVFPHLMFTPYFILWIVYYYILLREPIKVNKGELLLTVLLFSTFISMFLSNNEYIAIAYTVFTMLTILFVGLCTSRVIRIQQRNGNSFVPIISAALFNMMFFSFLYFIYEMFGSGRGIGLMTYIQTNVERTFDENKYLTAGFMEPAGFSLVAATMLAYFFAVFGVHQKDNSDILAGFKEYGKYSIIKHRYLLGLVIYSLFLLVISNSRTGYSGLIITFLVFMFLLHRYAPDNYIMRKATKLFVVIVVGIAVSVFIIRSVSMFDSFDRASLVGERQVDTTLAYLLTAEGSIESLMSSFWGTGAFSSSSSLFEGAFNGTTNVVNVYSTLLNVGATYGWITMILNILFYVYLVVHVGGKAKTYHYNQYEKVVILVSLALVVASILPLCPTLGLASNWTPASENIPVIRTIFFPPRVYSAIITAIIFGVLISQTDEFDG